MKGKGNGRPAPQTKSSPSLRLWHRDVPGPLWNGTQRVAMRQIRAYCHVVAREFHPRKIILFGSYATDCATPDSDVDLVVVMPFRGSDTDKVVEIRGRVEAPFPMDMLVWKPAQAVEGDAFTRAVLSEGKVMYEAGGGAGGLEDSPVHPRGCSSSEAAPQTLKPPSDSHAGAASRARVSPPR